MLSKRFPLSAFACQEDFKSMCRALSFLNVFVYISSQKHNKKTTKKPTYSFRLFSKYTLYQFGGSEQSFLELLRHTFLEPELGLLSRGICQINQFWVQ